MFSILARYNCAAFPDRFERVGKPENGDISGQIGKWKTQSLMKRPESLLGKLQALS